MTKTVAQKMGVKAGRRAFFQNAPADVLAHGVESTCLSVSEVWAGLKLTHPKSDKVYPNSHGQWPQQAKHV